MIIGDIIDWLMQDKQKNLFEIVFALALTVVFLILIALALWPLGKLPLAYSLARGYVVLWVAILVTILLVVWLQRIFRVDMYSHPDAFVISNLLASCILQAGWAAFAALTVSSYVVGMPIWIAVILYVVGFLSCLIAYFAVSSCFQGHIYKLISLPVASAGYIVFSVWPAGGLVMYGWLFDLI